MTCLIKYIWELLDENVWLVKYVYNIPKNDRGRIDTEKVNLTNAWDEKQKITGERWRKRWRIKEKGWKWWDVKGIKKNEWIMNELINEWINEQLMNTGINEILNTCTN